MEYAACSITRQHATLKPDAIFAFSALTIFFTKTASPHEKNFGDCNEFVLSLPVDKTTRTAWCSGIRPESWCFAWRSISAMLSPGAITLIAAATPSVYRELISVLWSRRERNDDWAHRRRIWTSYHDHRLQRVFEPPNWFCQKMNFAISSARQNFVAVNISCLKSFWRAMPD